MQTADQPSPKPLSALRWVIPFFILWVMLLAAAYWFFLVKPKQWFDVQMQQPPVLSEPVQQRALRSLLRARFPELQAGTAWFVRMKQSDCGCERFVELYHQSFAQQADPEGMQVVTLQLDRNELSDSERTLIRALVPATPSVVLFDPQGSVIYFGPYHQEGICNAENSYLEPVLQSLRQGTPLSVLNTLVFGCFCSVR